MKHYRCRESLPLFSQGMLIWDEELWVKDKAAPIWLEPGSVITMVKAVKYRTGSDLWQVIYGDIVGWLVVHLPGYPDYMNKNFEEIQGEP